MRHAIAILKVLAEIGPLIPKIGARVAEALADGTISAEDAEQFAIDVAKEIDIKVKVHGIDVVTEEAENHFLAFIAIVTANTVTAKAS